MEEYVLFTARQDGCEKELRCTHNPADGSEAEVTQRDVAER